ncbi:MAG: hypothetical protein J7527_12600, partial [Chitinophagaceae bacterium]|nr:hypothetical protein [Chitinophagaceae bacterium]
MQSLTVILTAVIFLGNTIAAASQKTIEGSIVFDGLSRSYSVYIPASYVKGQPVPLLFNLHGYGKDKDYQEEYRDFRPVADTAGFIIVHPNGTKERLTQQRFWNFGSVMGSKVDDLGFLEALVDTLSKKISIDQARVYCTGMSNGTFMAYYLACKSKRFAAIGGVSGGMSVKMFNDCDATDPVPVIQIHGTKDPINSYRGNWSSKGIEAVIEFWRAKNGCNPTAVTTSIPDLVPGDKCTAERIIYSGGTNGSQVQLIKITGGGHTWPGLDKQGQLGKVCQDFDARLEIWRFFRQFRRRSDS